jgi:hypothetical protein
LIKNGEQDLDLRHHIFSLAVHHFSPIGELPDLHPAEREKKGEKVRY